VTSFYNDLKKSAKAPGSKKKAVGFRRVLSEQSSEEINLNLNAQDSKALGPINLDVFYGMINFREQKKLVQMEEKNPLIAISASYDALAISSELSVAMENSGAGIMAVIQLSKVFHQLKVSQAEKNQGKDFKYDLLFVMTPTASLSHQAT